MSVHNREPFFFASPGCVIDTLFCGLVLCGFISTKEPSCTLWRISARSRAMEIQVWRSLRMNHTRTSTGRDSTLARSTILAGSFWSLAPNPSHVVLESFFNPCSRAPRAVTAFMPESALQLIEEAWNGYPYCKTVMTVCKKKTISTKTPFLLSLNSIPSLSLFHIQKRIHSWERNLSL